MLQTMSFRLVPYSTRSISRLEASFLAPCQFVKFGRRCTGHADMKGLRIGEQSGGRTIAERRTTVRLRCVKCKTRRSITQTEWEQLLGEAQKFLASERRQRKGVAAQT